MYTLQPAAQKVSCVCLNVVYSSVQGASAPRLRHFMEATELLDGVYEQELRMISDVVGTGHRPRSVELVRSPLERIVEASKKQPSADGDRSAEAERGRTRRARKRNEFHSERKALKI